MTCDPQVILSTDGVNQGASGRCYDAAGNPSLPATVSGINIDKTPPTATARVGPPANQYGWRRQNVTVSFSGTDALSGGVTCDPQVILSTDGVSQSTSGRCYDAAGNPSQLATVSGINIDKTPPMASISSPTNNAVYERNQNVTAAFACGDALSTVLSCTGTVGNGQRIDTSRKVKNAKFAVTATDRAGNTTKATATYEVK